MMKLAILLFTLMLGTAQPLRADDDQDRARAALEAGEILSLAVILQRISGTVTGVPIEVELERDDSIWIYELEIRRPDGQLVEVEVDAASGMILDLDEDEG